MMFAYSFLAITSYNIIQPLTRSKLISSLGAVNIPVRDLRRRSVHRRPDARLHAVLRSAAAPLGTPDLTGRDGGGHARLLDIVPASLRGPTGCRSASSSGAICSGSLPSANSGPSPTASTTPSGKAALRVHRRRRDARRHDRLWPHLVHRRDGRRQYATARERSHAHRLVCLSPRF